MQGSKRALAEVISALDAEYSSASVPTIVRDWRATSP